MSSCKRPGRQGPKHYVMFLLVLALNACWEQDLGRPEGEIAGCVSDSDCPTGLLCQLETCVGTSSPSWSVRLRFLPNGQATSAAVEVDSVDFEGAGAVRSIGTVRLPRSERLVLRVRTEDGEQLAAVVSARTTGLETAPLVYHGENLEDVTDPRLSIEVPAAWPTLDGGLRPVLYDLKVQPKDEAVYPPWVEEGFRVPDVGSAAEVLLPGADDRVSISGRLLLNEVNPSPVASVAVFGVNQNGHTISSRTQTDENGRFTLFFWPREEVEVGTLKFMRTVSSGPLPDLSQPIQIPSDGEVVLPSSYLGQFGAIREIQGMVTGLDEAGVSMGASGVALRFAAEVGNGTYRVDVALTDGDGRFDVSLYEGEYEVSLIPHIGSPFRATFARATITSATSLNFELGRKVEVRGTVIQPDGQPIALSRIKTLMRSWNDDESTIARAVPTRAQNGQTALDGTFALALDAGIHELWIYPDAQSGLPSSQHLITVPPATAEVQLGIFSIPSGAVVESILLGPDELPAAEIMVEAWRVVFGQQRRVGWGISDENGRLRLRLAGSE